jgi:lipopolysaccharide/colanic/teichoic acid biosynthesis glycosyltransferase
MLTNAEDPEQEYVMRVLPDKIALAKTYVRSASFLLDMSIILKTFTRIFL